VGLSTQANATGLIVLASLNNLFQETGSSNGVLQSKQLLHTPGILHADDTQPLLLYAGTGDISDLTLFSAKPAAITAGRDIVDIGFYIQNTSASSISVVSAGRDIIAYDANSPLLINSRSTGNTVYGIPQSGDIQISGPGTLEVLTGRNLDLGTGDENSNGTGAGITSIGNARNPYLPFPGANIISVAGLGGEVTTGLTDSKLDFQSFIKSFGSSPDGTRYLAESGGILGVSGESVSGANVPGASNSSDIYFKVDTVTPGSPAAKAGVKPGDILLQISGNNIPYAYDDSYLYSVPTGIQIGQETSLAILRDGNKMSLSITPGTNQIDPSDPSLSAEQQNHVALSLFYLVLRDSGRDHNDPHAPNYRNYTDGLDAIKALFPGTSWNGSINAERRDIRTKSGGDISLLAPGGSLTLATTGRGNPQAPPGVVTEHGGNINIFTHDSVSLGISRIFTLRGGNEIIWSSVGNIAAGSSSKTVQSAPPTRVLIDPQSANVQTDLAGLATGGGIGVLASVAGVNPGNVDLIAPVGTIDAGDAGIRVTGNLNISAAIVVNASNISAGGTSTGTAPSTPAAPSVGSISAASTAAGSSTATVENAAKQEAATPPPAVEEPLSVITVEVIGYGGGDDAGDNTNSDQDKHKEDHPKTEDAQ